MRNPILIKEKPQEGKVKGKINTYSPKARDRAIVGSSKITIFIHHPIKDSVPPDERGNEITDEKGT
jgi:hypothetical protein